jgi:hypothetical protein
MASGLLFLRAIQQHFQIAWSIPHGNKLICDNEGLLVRIEKTLSWSYLQPNATLSSEWDVKPVILETYRALGWKFAFQHVRSHQDDSVSAATLPLDVQLNIEADRLATDYLSTSEYAGNASLFPSAKCQLLINGDTISRQLPRAIRFQAGALPLQNYLKERNHWSQPTIDSVNWPAHGAAHSFHREQRCFLIKFGHRHLPLGKTIHRRDNKYQATIIFLGATPSQGYNGARTCSQKSRRN